MLHSESSQQLLHLPDHATSFKLSEFTIPADVLNDKDANANPDERAAVGGGFVVVNMYGNFSISVGRIDIGILSDTETELGDSSAKTNCTPFWETDGDALSHVRHNANSASNKCTAADMKMGGCGIVLYFTKVKYDTSGNRKILMNCLAKELVSFQMTRLLCLPGTGVSLVDLRYLRESYGGGDAVNGNKKQHQRTASYDDEKKTDEVKPLGREHRSPSFFEVTKLYDTPIPKLLLPTASAASLPTTAPQQDITAKFAAYSALGAISTLSLAKGWTAKQTNKQATHHRVLPPSPQQKKQGNTPQPLCQVVLVGLTSASAELYQLLAKDGRYDVRVADSKGVAPTLAGMGLNWSVPLQNQLDFKQALMASCHILMACTWINIPTLTADVVEELQCQAFLTLSDNALPTDIGERESSFITFDTKGLFDLADGVCDLGAYAKLYSLSREKNNDESAAALDSHTFTVTDSYQMGVKVMEKAIHLDSIVQQYDMEEKHQFYSMILEKDHLLDEINGAHLGLGTIIGNSSDRMTEWMWNKTKAMCPAMRALQNERRGRSAGGAKTQVNYVDLGAGNGAAARWICSQDSNIHVKCLNVSPKQNAENRQLSDESGLRGQITVETGTFERLPPEYGHSFDGCLSQDSFLHAFDKLNAFEEALRVTKGGGWLMISDLMCGEDQDTTSEELNSFVKENVVTSWVTPTQCVKIAKTAGWSDVQFTNCTTEIKLSLQGLLNKIKTLIESNAYKGINLRLLQTQRLALSRRIGQIDRGVFKWGILSARKPYDVVFITQPPVAPDYHPMMKYSTEDIDGNVKFGTNVVVLTIKDGMPREKIAELPSTTHLIVTMSAGLDHVDREAAAERGIKVARAAREQLVKSVADYTVSSLVFGLRDGFGNIGVPFPGAKDWNLSWNSDGVDLDRSKIGFIGIGKIVEETCRRIRALSSECELVYHVPDGIRSSFEEGTFRMFHVGFADLLSTCDAVVVLCPLTASTTNLVRYKEFSMMKKSAVFINMARGKIVDTEGMYRALNENLIRHAILDTTEPEPLPADHGLWEMERVTITPHFATNTHYVRKELVEDIPNQVEDALEGRGILRLEEERARRELSEAYRITREFGMDELVWNHISIRLSDNTYLITPGSLMFDDIRPQDLVKSGGSGNVTADIIHDAIYQNRGTDVKAIVHLHTPATVAVSCLEMGFVPLAQEAAPFVGRVARLPWGGVSNDWEEQKIIGECVASPTCNTLLMENHGFCCFGKTLGEAWVLAYYFDKACQTQLNCLSTGMPIKYPDPKVLAHAAEQATLPEFLPGACEWTALRKMLTRKRRW